jgi:hypothetical protein
MEGMTEEESAEEHASWEIELSDISFPYIVFPDLVTKCWRTTPAYSIACFLDMVWHP